MRPLFLDDGQRKDFISFVKAVGAMLVWAICLYASSRYVRPLYIGQVMVNTLIMLPTAIILGLGFRSKGKIDSRSKRMLIALGLTLALWYGCATYLAFDTRKTCLEHKKKHPHSSLDCG